MCCCGKSTINGQPDAYSWDGKVFFTRQLDPPELTEEQALIYDGPGRCGATDSHSFHYRLVKSYSVYELLVQHGGGRESIRLSWSEVMINLFNSLDENSKYWLLNSIYHTVHREVQQAKVTTRNEWSNAFVEKRIKKKKRNHAYSVWIDTQTPATT